MLSLSLGDQRQQFLLFVKNKQLLRNLTLRLEGTKNYISRNERDLLIQMLIYSGCYNSPLILALRKSAKFYLSKAQRTQTLDFLRNFLKDNETSLDNPNPTSDEERFELLLDGRDLTHDAWKSLQDMGAFQCAVFSERRKVELVGTASDDSFYQSIVESWNFEKPKKYFLYSGNSSISMGKLDSRSECCMASVGV